MGILQVVKIIQKFDFKGSNTYFFCCNAELIKMLVRGDDLLSDT